LRITQHLIALGLLVWCSSANAETKAVCGIGDGDYRTEWMYFIDDQTKILKSALLPQAISMVEIDLSSLAVAQKSVLLWHEDMIIFTEKPYLSRYLSGDSEKVDYQFGIQIYILDRKAGELSVSSTMNNVEGMSTPPRLAPVVDMVKIPCWTYVKSENKF